MSRAVRVLSLAACWMVLTACGQPETHYAGPVDVLQVRIALTGDVCGVTSASATVTGSLMPTIGPVPLSVVDAEIRGQIDGVPVGTQRQVYVAAFNAAGYIVYDGTAAVDVTQGQTATARLTLMRNLTHCPQSAGTGSIAIIGTLDTLQPGGDGGTDPDVLQGPELAFSFSDAVLTNTGVLHFLDDSGDRIRRLDLATRGFLPALQGSADVTAMAVAPDGSEAFLAYAGGRVERFDGATAAARFLVAAPENVSTMVVTGDFLFTIDGSGAWDTHAVYRRSTGERTDAQDWRNTSRSIVYSPLKTRVYFLDSFVSPTDVAMEGIDPVTGLLSAETGSPYHGDYQLPNPIRLLPDESGVIVGSGIIFNTSDLTYRSSVGFSFTDVAFSGGQLYLASASGSGTLLRTLSSTFDLLGSRSVPGEPLRLFVHAGKLVLVTRTASGLQVRFLAP